jgi:hypothetical protein
MLSYTSQPYVRGSKKNSVVIELVDATTGAAVTGKVAVDMTISVGRWRAALDVITANNLATALTPWTSSGFKELSAVRLPGLYRFDIPDADFVSDGISDVILVAALCTGCRPFFVMLPLTDIDPSESTRSRE